MVIASYLIDKAHEKGYAQGYAEGYPVGYAQGLAEGRAEGRTEGRTEGRAEAYEDVARQNKAYYKRMRQTLDAGEDFNEPPPRFGNNRR